MVVILSRLDLAAVILVEMMVVKIFLMVVVILVMKSEEQCRTRKVNFSKRFFFLRNADRWSQPKSYLVEGVEVMERLPRVTWLML